MRSFGHLARASTAALTVLVLGACNSGSAPCTVTPAVFNVPIAVSPALISPASGATGVSTGPLDVTVGNAFNVSMLHLRDGGGNQIYATTYRQGNPPSNDVRIGTFPQLAAQTTYQVFADVATPAAPANPCANTPAVTLAPVPELLGSFTTR